MKKQKCFSAALIAFLLLTCFASFFSTAKSNVPNGEMYIVFEGTFLSDGQPNSVAERIVNGKNLYGFPTYVEVTTAYPYGEINNALVDYFHSAGINVSARVWSDGGDNSIGNIESQIDQILAWASHVDMIMIDECNGDMYSYLQTLSNFVHNKGKLICFNMAGWSFSENHIPMADLISIEYTWREFVIEHSDWINSYPDKFFGVSYDLGYDYLGQPDITVDLNRAIYDTQEAWNSGILYYYAIGGTEGGGAFVLPTWYEDYLNAISTPTIDVPTVNIAKPTAIAYTRGTFNISIISTNSLFTWYNIKNGTDWVYAANVTYTAESTLTGFESGYYTCYAWAIGNGSIVAQDTVAFNVLVDSTLPAINMDAFWLFLYEGNFLGSVQAYLAASFINVQTAIALICMLFLVPLYLRTKSLMLICILWILLGGFFIAAMPMASGLAVLFMVLGTGGLVWRLFRGTTYG